WVDAARAAGPLCDRLRRWVEPVWGLRLPAVDYAHNDLNPSNILVADGRITGVVDWDEVALGSRALDLVALAIDCRRAGLSADRLLASARSAVGADGVRCLVTYRAIALLSHSHRYGAGYAEGLADEEAAAVTAVLDRLGGSSSSG